MTETRTCKYEPCSKPFEPTHPRQIFCEPTCRANQHYVDNPEKGRALVDGALRSVATHPLDEVRGAAEESAEKSRWTLVAREHLTHTLIETSYFSAEDFDALGIPAEHVNVGNSQMGRFSKQKLMEAISWRYSTKPSRKGGKLWTYRITEKGRRDLPKLLTDTRKELASAGDGTDAKHGDAQRRGAAEQGVPSTSPSGSVVSGHSQPGEEARSLPASPGAVPDQLQEGRDRQVMGAGCGEDRSAIPPNVGASARGTETDNPRRNTQPASRPEDQSESLSLLPEPLNLTDPDQRRAA